MEYKREMHKFMQGEYKKIPRDLNRNQYLRRINEVITNLKKQKESIQDILTEIRTVQDSSEGLIGSIRKLDNEVEEVIFQEAKKDKVAKKIYSEIVRLKENFDLLVTNIQE